MILYFTGGGDVLSYFVHDPSPFQAAVACSLDPLGYYEQFQVSYEPLGSRFYESILGVLHHVDLDVYRFYPYPVF